MAELTQAELETKIAAIDTQLDTLVAAPDRAMDFSIGPLSFSLSQKVRGLLKLREHYQGLLDTFPAEGFQRLAIDFSEEGEDASEYLGDSGE